MGVIAAILTFLDIYSSPSLKCASFMIVSIHSLPTCSLRPSSIEMIYQAYHVCQACIIFVHFQHKPHKEGIIPI